MFCEKSYDILEVLCFVIKKNDNDKKLKNSWKVLLILLDNIYF